MNLREGRIGRQEAASMAWIACVIPAIFTVSTRVTYENGNASYAATAFSALLALLLFWFVTAAMRARGCDTLSGLYRLAFGGFGAAVAAALTACLLAASAAVPMARMLLILGRYVFVNASEGRIALYFLIAASVLAISGLETVARTARLLVFWVFLSFLLTVVIAMPAFESYRLYPLLGGSAERLVWQSVNGTVRFLPALIALSICGRGVQGVRNVWRGGLLAAALSVLLASGVQFCLGLCYGYQTLSDMHAPIYRMTMAVRTGSAYLRTDKLLLFFWVVGAMLTAAFLCYSAGLLYAKSTRMRDARPACAVFSVLAVVLALLGEVGQITSEHVAELFFTYAWAFLAAPPALAAGIALLKKERRV